MNSTDSFTELHGVPALLCAAFGPSLAGEAAAVEVAGEALGLGAELVAVPLTRVGPGLFDPGTGLAARLVATFTAYRLHLVFVGDFTLPTLARPAMREFVARANRGDEVWFVGSHRELAERLGLRRRLGPGPGW
ncbi:DUF4180 domain-containing protein [Streptomyces hoynatensis]|uniref:DUF4180 domain-containing protein n=1 Tax=Streptomyces hoynatensis TaxID=1141874 RepID=A0A3A9YSZ0_9ACTN|nr:DUF4180 domain-containing protein [Streptomyces hoynatensis]RKN39192.1 DUF4180 domain-containing protein [Streptomyces hoynatensis]